MAKSTKSKSKDKKDPSKDKKDKKDKSVDKKSKGKSEKSERSSIKSAAIVEKQLAVAGIQNQIGNVPMVCVMHKSELKLYCETCEEVICELCITLGPHNNQVLLALVLRSHVLAPQGHIHREGLPEPDRKDGSHNQRVPCAEKRPN